MAVRADEVRAAGRDELFVAVVEREPELRNRLESALAARRIGRFASLDELDRAGAQSSLTVVVLGPSSAPEDVARLGEMCRDAPGVGGLLVVDVAAPKLLRASLRAGLDDAIHLDEIEAELDAAAAAVGERLVREAERVPVRAVPMRGSGRARITAVFSPKGGVGKSAIAVNLATVLARGGDETVIVVDLDLQFGDVAVMLRLQPRHTIGEIASSDELDQELVQSLLVEHEPSGMWILAAPTEPSTASHLDGRTIGRLLEILRGFGGHVIVDTPPALSDVVLELLDTADDIAFVVGMDVPSVKNARIGLHALRVLGIPADRIVMVLNRADSKVNLAVRDVERALERKIDVKIPADVVVTQSINKGTPAALDYERSHFARSLVSMSELLRTREREAAVRA